MLSCHLADLLQDFLTILCQIKGIQAPVIRVCSPLNESPLLEIVEDRHQAAGMNPQLRGELLLVVAGLVAAATLRHGAPYVTPFAPAEQLRSFLAQSPTAVRVSNFFLFGSAVPFGIFAVTTVSRLRFLHVRAAGTNIALLGG